MTFVALMRDPAMTVATDQLVLRRAEVGPAEDVLALANRLADKLASAESDRQAAQQQGFEQGYADGKTAGMSAGREEVARELVGIAIREQQEKSRLRQMVADLAVQAVAKIAEGLGAATVVTEMARTAATDLLPVSALTVWVHPSVRQLVTDDLGRLSADTAGQAPCVEVRVDDELAPFDCILETAAGRIIASLDSQLEQLKIALRDGLKASQERLHD